MSGLSLASHPRLAGAGRHRFGANHVVCALALCALVLRARPCGGFACFASCRSPLPGHAGPPALTHLACPRALAWAHFVFAWGVPCWGLLWACLLGGWLGWVFAFGLCSLGVFACFGVGAVSCVRRLPVWGWWDNRVPPPLHACLLACSRLWCGRCWRVRGTALPDGRRAALLGRDMVVPPHTAWRCPRCVARG